MRATDAAMLIIALCVAWAFYRAQKDPAFSFNLFDLVMVDGKLSNKACVFVAAFAVTSWVIIRLTVTGKMTEGYYTAYGAMWIIPIVAKMFSGPSTTTTQTDTTTSTRKETK